MSGGLKDGCRDTACLSDDARMILYLTSYTNHNISKADRKVCSSPVSVAHPLAFLVSAALFCNHSQVTTGLAWVFVNPKELVLSPMDLL